MWTSFFSLLKLYPSHFQIATSMPAVNSEMFYSSVYLLCLFKSNAPSAVEPSPENLSELQPSASEPCDFVGKQPHDLSATNI